MSLDPLEAQAIVSALRTGVVPRRGLERFATGLGPLEAAVLDELEFIATGKGASKWLNGDYGSGKTFAARHLCARARERGFATAEVQISINDTPLHQIETVYRRLIERLETNADGPNAFRAVVDAWLYRVGNEVRALQGYAEDDPRLADATEQRLEDKLSAISKKTPAFAQVLRAFHRALHDGDYAAAQGLLAWLGGQPHTSRALLKKAGVRGQLDGPAALTFLAGLLQLLRESGSPGLVLVLDEVETLQRFRPEEREKSLNGLRQLVDALAQDELPGLYLLVTGTPLFFTGYKGVQSLQPLHQRVQVDFGDDPAFDNLRAPQVRLLPFDAPRLLAVGQKVRDLYPARHPARVKRRVGPKFLRRLVDGLTGRFGGNLSIAPRLFLRELVDVLDRVDQHEAFDPLKDFKLVLADNELTDEERAVAKRPARPVKPHRLPV